MDLKNNAIPRQNALVKFDLSRLEHPYWATSRDAMMALFTDEKGNPKTYIYMGDIPNQPGHCILFEAKTGKPCFFHHTDDFIELTDDET